MVLVKQLFLYLTFFLILVNISDKYIVFNKTHFQITPFLFAAFWPTF